jgi:hypothetical protein
MEKTKVLVNLQGRTFRSEQEAVDFYGNRYSATVLEWCDVDDEGDVI